MMRSLRDASRLVVFCAIGLGAVSAAAQEQAVVTAVSPLSKTQGAPEYIGTPRSYPEISDRSGIQVSSLPLGTIQLRLVSEIGGPTVPEPYTWQILSYTGDDYGKRRKIAEVTGATPEMVLPAGWYVVQVRVPNQVIRHAVEVVSGRTYLYTLLKN